LGKRATTTYRCFGAYLRQREKAVTDEDERYLRAILDALRADDGKSLRALLKSLSKSDEPDAKDLAQVLISHPSLRDLIPH
jgi:hypothetical protein